jgi:3-keto-5-aminohexanoate cleavage enzyme
MSDKVVISAALSGGATMKDQNPAVPYTPEEFAEEAYKCYNSGVSAVHIHVRNPDTGLPTADLDQINVTISAIRDRCPDLLINMSTAIAAGIPQEDRIAPVKSEKPELASLNTNSMNFAIVNWGTGEVLQEIVFSNTFEMLISFAKTMKENHVKPELEVYDLGGMYNVLLVRKQGIFEEPMHFQLVFGVAGGVPYNVSNFARLRELIPSDASWSVCGVGPNQFKAGMTAAVNGGHIRVGLEDNVRMPNGELAKGSWEQAEWAGEVAMLAGRDVASPSEARRIFHTRGK